MTGTGTSRIRIAAPPEVVYDLVADVRRMGEWSPECVGAEIPTDAPVGAGSTFTGRNRRGDQEWTSRCRVLAAERPQLFSFAAGDDDDATIWTYEFRSDGTTTAVVESFDSQALRDPSIGDQGAARTEQLVADLAATLAALKDVAERENER